MSLERSRITVRRFATHCVWERSRPLGPVRHARAPWRPTWRRRTRPYLSSSPAMAGRNADQLRRSRSATTLLFAAPPFPQYAAQRSISFRRRSTALWAGSVGYRLIRKFVAPPAPRAGSGPVLVANRSATATSAPTATVSATRNRMNRKFVSSTTQSITLLIAATRTG
jgi:hypothetical protein